ncbi:MAG: hypothetical protein KFB97_13440 [Cyanobium sp. M30B3]|nr:MAG: hypothetical protein KFB97_13440 [Cyanobium sp. M30B3]
MPSLQVAMLLAGVLLLIGITSSKFSARLGIPVLVLFLAIATSATPQSAVALQAGA